MSSISVASIEEMCYGTIDKLKSYAFELRTPGGEVKLACESEQGTRLTNHESRINNLLID